MNTVNTRSINTIHSSKFPGKVGATARLIVLALVSLVGFCSSFFSLPSFIPKRGFWQAILDSLGGFGIILLLAAFFWAVMKWLPPVMKKSFGIAKAFWNCWAPLTFFGLYIKLCIFLVLALVPLCSLSIFLAPLTGITYLFAMEDIGLLSALLLLIVGCACVAGLGFWDLCILRRRKPVTVIRRWWAARRAA